MCLTFHLPNSCLLVINLLQVFTTYQEKMDATAKSKQTVQQNAPSENGNDAPSEKRAPPTNYFF